MPASGGGAPVRPWGIGGPAVAYADEIGETDRTEIDDLLGSWDPGLFPSAQVSIRVLVGGANNRNYVVEAGERKYALRIANRLAERLAVDRASALRAQADAAAGGLAPAVIASRLPDGHVLSEFLEGQILGESDLGDLSVLGLVGETFARLHGLTTEARHFSPFSDIRHWAELARADQSALPDGYDELLDWVWRIESAVAALDLPFAFCHNDTVPQNFIRSGNRLKLVDWDYGGRGYAAFELASFCATADLPQEREEIVLRAYTAEPSEPQRALISLFRYVAVMREVAWVVMAQPILEGTTTPAEADFYENYLATHLRLARETAAARSLKPAMKLVSDSPDPAW